MAETKIGGFLGVRRRPAPPARFPWYARIGIASGKVEHISSFKSPRQAAEAYDRAVLHYFGAGVLRNFPEKSLSPANAATIRAEIRRFERKRTLRASTLACTVTDLAGARRSRSRVDRYSSGTGERSARRPRRTTTRCCSSALTGRALTSQTGTFEQALPPICGSAPTRLSRRGPPAGSGVCASDLPVRADRGSQPSGELDRRTRYTSERGRWKKTPRAPMTGQPASILVPDPGSISPSRSSSRLMPRR